MKSLLVAVFLFAAAQLLTAQTVRQQPKLDGILSALHQALHSNRPTTRATGRDTLPDLIHIGSQTINLAATIGVEITTHDNQAATVANHLHKAGYEAAIITSDFLTATIPAHYLDSLTTLPQVISVESPRVFSPLLDEARKDGKVDLLQAGTGLDTPFTGRGVIIGVIDRSFQYRHPAFLDPTTGESRVRVVWDRSGYSPNATQDKSLKPITDIPDGTDLVDLSANGHGTHVAGIAAGSETGNQLHGIAPEAELILIPSTFLSKEVIEDVKYIRDLAIREKKPWVINMSFGGQIGPHDGRSSYDRAINAMLRPGGFVVAAMGNEGDRCLHTTGSLKAGETRYVLFERNEAYANDESRMEVDIWEQATDRRSHFEFKPYILSHNKLLEQTQVFWKKHCWTYSGLNSSNNKINHQYFLDLSAVRKEIDDPQAAFVLAVEPLQSNGEKAQTLHIWLGNTHDNISTHTLSGKAGKMLRGDNKYQVSEGGASVPRAIAVGSYTIRKKIPLIASNAHQHQTQYEFSNPEKIGSLSYFSSIGPLLDGNYPKPAVLAPGSWIKSAMNGIYPGFDINSDNNFLTNTIELNGKSYYYSAMQGTSMATPFVTGVLALWLQANPHLTYRQVMDILQETSRKHTNMHRANWLPNYGYGLIDAYAGLKKALELGKTTGIERPSHTTSPITLSQRAEGWHILFNNPESYANITLYSLDGRILSRQNVQHPTQGTEVILPISHLQAGVYLLNVTTPGGNILRRLVMPRS